MGDVEASLAGRLEQLNACLLSATADSHANLQQLTALCGELLGAACALYNRREGDRLCAVGTWGTPPDFDPCAPAAGLLCQSVIERASDEPLLVRQLQQSTYAETDPHVRQFGLETYLGQVVRSGGRAVGSLCVVYTRDVEPSAADLLLLRLLAAAVGNEDTRGAAMLALRESEERYRTLVEHIDLGISMIDTQRTVVAVNAAACKLYGRPVEQLVGQPCYEAFLGTAEPCATCHLCESLASGEARTFEVAGTRADGQPAVHRLHVFPVKAADGASLGVVQVAEDVTAARDAERQSRLLQAVLDHAPMDLWVREPDGRVVLQSRACTEHWGQLVGTHDRPANVDEGTLTAWNERVARVLAGETIMARDDVVVAGERRYFQHLLVPIRDGDSIGGVFGAALDVTGQHLAEAERLKLAQRLEAVERDASLGGLAGGLAHDFNNLLTAIGGYAELALMELPEDSSVRADLASIQAASGRAADLCAKMLAYAGRLRLSPQPLELAAWLPRQAAALANAAPAATLRLEPGTRPLCVQADAGQLQRVLLELVANAAEALAGATGDIVVSTGEQRYDEATLDQLEPTRELPAGDYAWLQVVDTGAGIAPEHLPRICEPFFSTRFAGRGLGLAAVRGIVRAHAGVLDVRSEPGRGTTVRVLLPVLPDPSPATPPTASSPASHGRVLVVDDEAEVREIARRLVERTGLATFTAASGPAALTVYAAHADEIGLILLDHAMPGMDGAETLQALRAAGCRAQVVLSSGFDEVAARQQFAGLELAGFLPKPYSSRDLSNLLARLCVTPAVT